MSASVQYVTVYRSMDASAEEDCQVIRDFLASEGITATMLDDSAPGVPEGTFAVQVPQADSRTAEKLIRANKLPKSAEQVDPSANLDLETVFHSEGSAVTAEIEALSIQNLLESNGIVAVLVGDSVLPNLPFEVRVAREKAQLARELIAEAEQAGRAELADEGE